jgi:hypothetical protein
METAYDGRQIVGMEAPARHGRAAVARGALF